VVIYEGMRDRGGDKGHCCRTRGPAKVKPDLVGHRLGGASWALAGILSVCLFYAGSARADSGAFATASGNCSDGSITFPAQSSAHPDAIFRFQSTGSSGELGQPYGLQARFGSGDVGWGPFGKVDAGTSPALALACSSGSVTASLADRPTTPTTFSAVTSPSAFSFLSFTAPGDGQYVLDATVNQGAISVQGVSAIIQSSGEYSLSGLTAGNAGLRAGSHDLRVDAQNGPSAQWSLTVRELPVAINGLSFGQAYMAPGTGLPATFSVTGDTEVTATVFNAAGQAVRNLGSFPVAEGSSSVPWDGRGASAAPLPDGLYTLTLVSKDPSGDITSARTMISLDGTPPSSALISPATIRPSQSATFYTADAGSGVSSVSAIIDGQDVGDFGSDGTDGGMFDPLPPNGQMSFRAPSSGWSSGPHTWEIVATDRVGNRANVTGAFAVSTVHPTPSGGKRRSPRASIRRCGQVSFRRQSEDLAASITAQGVSCRVARELAARTRPNKYATGSHRSFRAKGFRCSGYAHLLGGVGKTVRTYLCVRGSKRVRFDR